MEIPIYAGGHIRRVEDVKKILYAGCQKAVLNYGRSSNVEMTEEVSKRFGQEKIASASRMLLSTQTSCRNMEA